jgi:sodium/potassium-transporting ATPase subunit alpha
MDSDGTALPLDNGVLAGISATQEEYASRGQRVLLLTKKVVHSDELDKETFSDPNRLEDRLIDLNVDLVIVGLVALVDPPRPDTAHTVSVCRRAGIRFAMVTGYFNPVVSSAKCLRSTFFFHR